MNANIHPKKPDVGSWTQLYPEIGTGTVSYRNSITQEAFDIEREAIFKRMWLNIGRVEQLPKVGSYFTREIDVAKTSILVVRGTDNKIRAFHNMCSHRGNKLVWNEHPKNEVQGTCRQFQCKYHAWRYGLDGQCTSIARPEEFFCADKEKLGLTAVHCDIWEGFVYVNLAKDAPEQTLKEFQGKMGASLEGYPFDQMTEVYAYRAEVKSNWKLFVDAFQEIYHAPYLHGGMSSEMAAGVATADAAHFELFGDHRMVSWLNVPPAVDYRTPIEKLLKAGLFGPDEKAEVGPLPEALNPARHPHWGLDSFWFFPNFALLTWEKNWYITYHYWPLAPNKHIFEARIYFKPPKNAAERLALQLSADLVKEYALQDSNTLEATQSMLESEAKTEFLHCDQEILCRAFHKSVDGYIEAYRAKHGVPK